MYHEVFIIVKLFIINNVNQWDRRQLKLRVTRVMFPTVLIWNYLSYTYLMKGTQKKSCLHHLILENFVDDFWLQSWCPYLDLFRLYRWTISVYGPCSNVLNRPCKGGYKPYRHTPPILKLFLIGSRRIRKNRQ